MRAWWAWLLVGTITGTAYAATAWLLQRSAWAGPELPAAQRVAFRIVAGAVSFLFVLPSGFVLRRYLGVGLRRWVGALVVGLLLAVPVLLLVAGLLSAVGGGMISRLVWPVGITSLLGSLVLVYGRWLVLRRVLPRPGPWLGWSALGAVAGWVVGQAYVVTAAALVGGGTRPQSVADALLAGAFVALAEFGVSGVGLVRQLGAQTSPDAGSHV